MKVWFLELANDICETTDHLAAVRADLLRVSLLVLGLLLTVFLLIWPQLVMVLPSGFLSRIVAILLFLSAKHAAWRREFSLGKQPIDVPPGSSTLCFFWSACTIRYYFFYTSFFSSLLYPCFFFVREYCFCRYCWLLDFYWFCRFCAAFCSTCRNFYCCVLSGFFWWWISWLTVCVWWFSWACFFAEWWHASQCTFFLTTAFLQLLDSISILFMLDIDTSINPDVDLGSDSLQFYPDCLDDQTAHDLSDMELDEHFDALSADVAPGAHISFLSTIWTQIVYI